ncbi:MAG: phosphoglycerate mutase family protein [bacterium]|nr:phosphoglycerate mutase family protein [bacterium]
MPNVSLLPKSLVLVRHGEDERMGRESATTCHCRLTKRGRKQSAKLGEWLRKNHSFDKYFCSYYFRTRETFRIVYPRVKAIEDSRIVEVRRGMEEFIPRKKAEKVTPWNKRAKESVARYHRRPLNGDGWTDKESDLRNFWLTLQIECANQDVVVFGHGKTVPIWGKILHGWTTEQAIAEYEQNKPEFASVTVYRRKGDSMALELDNFAPWKHAKKKKDKKKKKKKKK